MFVSSVQFYKVDEESEIALAGISLSGLESVRRKLEEERRLREERNIPVKRWIHRPGIDQCYDLKNLVSD